MRFCFLGGLYDDQLNVLRPSTACDIKCCQAPEVATVHCTGCTILRVTAPNEWVTAITLGGG